MKLLRYTALCLKGFFRRRMKSSTSFIIILIISCPTLILIHASASHATQSCPPTTTSASASAEIDSWWNQDRLTMLEIKVIHVHKQGTGWSLDIGGLNEGLEMRTLSKLFRILLLGFPLARLFKVESSKEPLVRDPYTYRVWVRDMKDDLERRDRRRNSNWY